MAGVVFLLGLLSGITLAIGVILILNHQRCPRIEGGSLVYIVPATNPDVAYSITPPTNAVDAEGNTVPISDLTYEVTSDNSGAVAVNPDPADPLKGTVTFGAPNADGSPALANINVLVKASDGSLLGSFGAQFTVPAGPAVAIVGGGIAFEGLTEV